MRARFRSGSELISQLDEISFCGLGGFAGRNRRVRRTVELDHDVHRLSIFLQSIENAGDIDLALPERAIAGEILSTDEVLEMHMAEYRQEVLHDLRRVSAAFLKLAHVGRE